MVFPRGGSFLSGAVRIDGKNAVNLLQKGRLQDARKPRKNGCWTWVISHVPMFHITQPLGINGLLDGYYKVMSNIPKMGHLPIPVEEFAFEVKRWLFTTRWYLATIGLITSHLTTYNHHKVYKHPENIHKPYNSNVSCKHSYLKGPAL